MELLECAPSPFVLQQPLITSEQSTLFTLHLRRYLTTKISNVFLFSGSAMLGGGCLEFGLLDPVIGTAGKQRRANGSSPTRDQCWRHWAKFREKLLSAEMHGHWGCNGSLK